jgi:hypothetical protein
MWSCCGGCWKAEEESSFCEQKEAKKLHPFAPALAHLALRKRTKVFCFFFPKKKRFLSFLGSSMPPEPARPREMRHHVSRCGKAR